MIRDLTLVLFGVFLGMAIITAIHLKLSPCNAATVARQVLPK